jgi:hypothetical protein
MVGYLQLVDSYGIWSMTRAPATRAARRIRDPEHRKDINPDYIGQLKDPGVQSII